MVDSKGRVGVTGITSATPEKSNRHRILQGLYNDRFTEERVKMSME